MHLTGFSGQEAALKKSIMPFKFRYGIYLLHNNNTLYGMSGLTVKFDSENEKTFCFHEERVFYKYTLCNSFL